MWNTQEFGGGGFVTGGAEGVNSPGQGASPQVKKERRAQNLFPTTIRTILNSGDDGLQIDGVEIQMVSVVGIIRSVEVTSTKTSYTLDDCTGIIDAVQWTDSDSEMNDIQSGPLMEMTYCKLVGTIRTQQGKKHIMIFNIDPIKDINWITKHLAEVIHNTLKIKHLQGMRGGGGAANVSHKGGTFGAPLQGQMPSTSNNAMYASNDAGAVGLTGKQRVVFQYLQQSNDDGGVGRREIYSTFQGKINSDDIDHVLDFLSNEGHIYTTVDDDTFRTTDT